MPAPPPMTAGVTQQGSSVDGKVVRHILGQTYTPLSLTETSFSWHALLPRRARSCRRTSIRRRTSSSTCWRGGSTFVLDGQAANASAGEADPPAPRHPARVVQPQPGQYHLRCSGCRRRASCGTCSRRSTTCPTRAEVDPSRPALHEGGVSCPPPG